MMEWLINAAHATLQSAGHKLVTIELLKPTLVNDPNETGRQVENWTNPTIVGELKRGNMQPASLRALQRAGMLGKINVKQIYCEPLAAMPEGRVRVDGTVYVVRSAEPWESYTQMLVEEL
jgi:hypothetical protein